MADSILFPEAECSLGIGIAIRIPDPSSRFMFESIVVKYSTKQSNVINWGKRKKKECSLPISRAQSSGESTRQGAWNLIVNYQQFSPGNN